MDIRLLREATKDVFGDIADFLAPKLVILLYIIGIAGAIFGGLYVASKLAALLPIGKEAQAVACLLFFFIPAFIVGAIVERYHLYKRLRSQP